MTGPKGTFGRGGTNVAPPPTPRGLVVVTASDDDAPSHKADGGMLKGVRSIAADGQHTNVTKSAGRPQVVVLLREH
jgi:hypothetical protein